MPWPVVAASGCFGLADCAGADAPDCEPVAFGVPCAKAGPTASALASAPKMRSLIFIDVSSLFPVAWRDNQKGARRFLVLATAFAEFIDGTW